MFDNILSAVLTFGLLASGTVAIGSEMLQPARAAAPVVVMPQVTITAQRVESVAVVTMPTVTVTGRREAIAVALADSDAAAID